MPALDLVTYNKQLQPAMESIFGNVFITKDLNVAKKICFHEGIKKKCVTLEGDVVDPAGTLSGGSMQGNASILILLEDIKKQEVTILNDFYLALMSYLPNRWPLNKKKLNMQKYNRKCNQCYNLGNNGRNIQHS